MVQTRNIAIQLQPRPQGAFPWEKRPGDEVDSTRFENNLHASFVARFTILRGLPRTLLWLWNWDKYTSCGLVIYSFLKDDAFTATKKEAAF